MTKTSSPTATPLGLQGSIPSTSSPLTLLIESPHHYYKQIYQYTGTYDSENNTQNLSLATPSTHQLLTSHLSTPSLTPSQTLRHSFLITQVNQLQKAIAQLEWLRSFLGEIRKEGSIGTFDIVMKRQQRNADANAADRMDLAAAASQMIPSARQTVQLMQDVAQRVAKQQQDKETGAIDEGTTPDTSSQQYIQSFLLSKQKLCTLLEKFSQQLSNNVLFHRYLLQLEWQLVRDGLWTLDSEGTIKIGIGYGEVGRVAREIRNAMSDERTNAQNAECFGTVEYVFPQGIAYGFKEERLRLNICTTPQQQNSDDKMTDDADDNDAMEDLHAPYMDKKRHAALSATSYNLPPQPFQRLETHINRAHNSLFNLQLFRFFSQIAFQSKDKIQILSYEQNEITVRVAPPHYFLTLRIQRGTDHPFWVLHVEQNCVKEENGGNELVKILLEDALYRSHLFLKSNPVDTFQTEQQRKNRAFSKRNFPTISHWFMSVLYYLRHAVVCDRVRQVTSDVELLRFSYPDRSDCVVYIGPNNEQRVPIFIQGVWICIGAQKLQVGELKAKLSLMEDEARDQSQFRVEV